MSKIRKFMAMAVAVAVIMIIAVPAFAADETCATAEYHGIGATEVPAINEGDGVMPLDFNGVFIVGDQYTTVAYVPSGINGKVYIAIDQDGYNGWTHQINVKMLDTNGNVVWSADNATGVMAEGSWFAGSNVTTVLLQIMPRSWFSPVAYYQVRVAY